MEESSLMEISYLLDDIYDLAYNDCDLDLVIRNTKGGEEDLVPVTSGTSLTSFKDYDE